MPVVLEEWQKALKAHFQGLAEERAKTGYPLFALEHGLSEPEIDEISIQLRARLKQGTPLSRHWLPWVVYATERGYSYAGDEYWRSFEEQTPDWEGAHRYSLARCFRRFLTTYNGVKPSGPWAEHFRIIALPITHAILPRYLQLKFAKILYELRFQLARLDEISPGRIGRVLSSHGYHSSTRFQEFLQQEELTGRIVLGLLHSEPVQGKVPIYPATLNRIVADLEKVRNAREWLKEARRTVVDRFAGLSRSPAIGTFGSSGRVPGSKTGRETHPEVRPSFFLRYNGSSNWSVILEMPSFRGLGALNVEIRRFLQSKRCRLNGANDYKPSGWLLSGSQRGVLKRWPDHRKPLIEFEESDSTVDHILSNECRIHEGPYWLFRIGRDWLAREISGLIVRPGRDYVIVSTGDFPELRPEASPCNLACEGVKAIWVNVPANVTSEHIRWFGKLGVQVARTIRIWPAGLPGRGWSGEGSSEWLTSERPCLGITHDHPIDAYELSLSDGSRVVIEAGRVGHPVFVQLPELSAGTHALSVKARRSNSLSSVITSPPAEGFMELRVRGSIPWVPGTTAHSGLVVTVDPYDPDLATFWENQIDLSVTGPASHQVVCEVALENARGEEILSDTVGRALDLPVTPATWRSRFASFVRREDCAERYLEASAGSLTIRGDELGEYKLQFEHQVRPLRWVARRDGDATLLRLIDDTDSEKSSAACFRIDMEVPASRRKLDPEEALKGIKVKAPGELFTAQHGEYKSEIAIAAGLAGSGLQGLNVRPNVENVAHGDVSVPDALLVLSTWKDAPIAGPLADIRRSTVVDSVIEAIVGVIAGSRWLDFERRYATNPTLKQSQELLQANVFRRSGFAAVLQRDHAKAAEGNQSGCQWFCEVAHRFDICRNRDISTFAYELAFHPEGVFDKYSNKCNALTNSLKKDSALFRGARLLALRNKFEETDKPAGVGEVCD